MASVEFESLLERMPGIADAVNKFSSEAVQREAFLALVKAFGIRPSDGDEVENDGSELLPEPSTNRGSKRKSETSKAKSRPKKASNTPSILKTLDLAPKGKKSFKDFVAEKRPASNEDKYSVVVYYLEQILEISPISLDHIATVFRLTPTWKEPKKVATGIRMTSHRKGTIDCSDINDLSTTPQGRNFVEHDLPLVKATKTTK